MEIDPLSPDDHTLPGQPSYVSSYLLRHRCSVRAAPISIDCPTFLNLSCVDLRYIALNSLTLHQLHPGRSRSLVRYHNRLHVNCLLGYLSLAGYVPAIKTPFDISCQGPWVVSQVTTGGSDRTQPADQESAGWPRASIGARRSRTNADDRLPVDPLGLVEGGDGVIEGRDVADVRPQWSVPHPPDDLTQLGTIGLDNEVNRQAIDGPRLGWPDDGHQCSSGPDHASGPLPDVAADD